MSNNPESPSLNALNALIESSEGYLEKVSKDLLKDAYQIEFEHQFDEERTYAIKKLEDLVERFIENQSSPENGHEA